VGKSRQSRRYGSAELPVVAGAYGDKEVAALEEGGDFRGGVEGFFDIAKGVRAAGAAGQGAFPDAAPFDRPLG
jgi:hypothetical protein